MSRPNFIHAGALTPVTEPLCHWRFDFEDVHLRCDDTVLPGELFCADHFIEWAHSRRRFPSTTLKGSNE
jgi:hypothetical protein